MFDRRRGVARRLLTLFAVVLLLLPNNSLRYADFFEFRRDLQQVFQAQAASRCSTVVAWLSSAIVSLFSST